MPALLRGPAMEAREIGLLGKRGLSRSCETLMSDRPSGNEQEDRFEARGFSDGFCPRTSLRRSHSRPSSSRSQSTPAVFDPCGSLAMPGRLWFFLERVFILGGRSEDLEVPRSRCADSVGRLGLRDTGARSALRGSLAPVHSRSGRRCSRGWHCRRDHPRALSPALRTRRADPAPVVQMSERGRRREVGRGDAVSRIGPDRRTEWRRSTG